MLFVVSGDFVDMLRVHDLGLALEILLCIDELLIKLGYLFAFVVEFYLEVARFFLVAKKQVYAEENTRGQHGHQTSHINTHCVSPGELLVSLIQQFEVVFEVVLQCVHLLLKRMNLLRLGPSSMDLKIPSRRDRKGR